MANNRVTLRVDVRITIMSLQNKKSSACLIATPRLLKHSYHNSSELRALFLLSAYFFIIIWRFPFYVDLMRRKSGAIIESEQLGR